MNPKGIGSTYLRVMSVIFLIDSRWAYGSVMKRIRWRSGAESRFGLTHRDEFMGAGTTFKLLFRFSMNYDILEPI